MFTQTWNRFQQGAMCQKCGVDRNKGGYCVTLAERHKDSWQSIDAIVYFLKFYNDDEIFYKIGITKSTLEKRLSWIKCNEYNIDVIHTIKTNLYDAIYKERELHEFYSEYRYRPKHKFGGYTECFSKIIEVEVVD